MLTGNGQAFVFFHIARFEVLVVTNERSEGRGHVEFMRIRILSTCFHLQHSCRPQLVVLLQMIHYIVMSNDRQTLLQTLQNPTQKVGLKLECRNKEPLLLSTNIRADLLLRSNSGSSAGWLSIARSCFRILRNRSFFLLPLSLFFGLLLRFHTPLQLTRGEKRWSFEDHVKREVRLFERLIQIL